MEAVELTWAERMRLEGREQGEQRGKREAIVLLVRERFGTPAPKCTARLESVSNGDLDQLLIRVLRANSLDEVTMGLGDRPDPA